MSREVTPNQMIEELESFLGTFRQYGDAIYREDTTTALDQLRSRLQRTAPKITDTILSILGDGGFDLRNGIVAYRDLLSNALMGGNNALPHNFRDFDAAVTLILQKAIGTIEAGLWPPKTPPPVLIIRDAELRQRCADLLSAPGNYDRVIREATTVLEERMRQKPPHEILTQLIPSSGDQVGENLVNKLFSPDDPILSVSSDKRKRVAFHKVLIGVVSYLRNPYHHRLDAQTEWSWAWSTVGFIDQFLAKIDSCTVAQRSNGGPR